MTTLKREITAWSAETGTQCRIWEGAKVRLVQEMPEEGVVIIELFPVRGTKTSREIVLAAEWEAATK